MKADRTAVEHFREEPGPAVPTVSRAQKVAAIKRELSYRERAYPKWVEAGKLSQKEADEQLAFMRAILEDYERQPWPQLAKFTSEWHGPGLRLKFLDVPIRNATRDELVAIVGFMREALEETAGGNR